MQVKLFFSHEENMPYFTWSPSYSVGVKELDTQHQAMIEIINRLHEAMRTGKGTSELGGIFSEMVKYAQFHFTSEEKILTSAMYPDFRKQKAEHDGFIKKHMEYEKQFKAGKLALSIEVLDFLRNWWTGHIQGEDMKYAPYLKAKGIA
jgi:hemerythrin